MKVDFTENGAREVARLEFDIIRSINRIIKYVPKHNLLGISRIVVMDIPLRNKHIRSQRPLASYTIIGKICEIHLYVKNIYEHIIDSKSFTIMLPIQEYGLASVIYHEIGHHVGAKFGHNINKRDSERYANAYAERLLDNFILDNEAIIDRCFCRMYELADRGELCVDVVNSMKSGWQNKYSVAAARRSLHTDV